MCSLVKQWIHAYVSVYIPSGSHVCWRLDTISSSPGLDTCLCSRRLRSTGNFGYGESAILNLIINALVRNRGPLSPPLAERKRPRVSTSSRTLRWKYYGGLFTALPFYIALDFRGNAFDALVLSPFRGTELRVFRCDNEIRIAGPCQDAGEGFRIQEKLVLVALLQCESSLYAYCCEFGVPCECSREITTAGQCSHTSSVPMWTRFASEANHQ